VREFTARSKEGSIVALSMADGGGSLVVQVEQGYAKCAVAVLDSGDVQRLRGWLAQSTEEAEPEVQEEVERVIIRNSALCSKCGDEIESKHVHDFVRCSCGAAFVDGGHDYLRRGGDALDTSLVVPDEVRTHRLEHSYVIRDVHHSALCEGRPCTIHNRSEHSMRAWPQVLRDGMVLRKSPDGVLHPDPDEPLVQAFADVARRLTEERPMRAPHARGTTTMPHRLPS